MAELAIRYRDKGVVAVDIAGPELVKKSQLHVDAFKVITLISVCMYLYVCVCACVRACVRACVCVLFEHMRYTTLFIHTCRKPKMLDSTLQFMLENPVLQNM